MNNKYIYNTNITNFDIIKLQNIHEILKFIYLYTQYIFIILDYIIDLLWLFFCSLV